MTARRRLTWATLIWIVPALAFGLIYALAVRSDRYGDTMGFSVAIFLPAILAGLPWSLSTVLTEAVLKQEATFINFALIASAYLLNVWWAVGKWSFGKVSTTVWVVTGVQCLAYFGIR